MLARQDWGESEAAIAFLLSAPRNASARAQLLASLDVYSRAVVHEARALGPIVPSADDREKALVWLLCPVFVCGHHRSGTTLLKNLLDGHPELLSLPSEGTYFSSFAYVARRARVDDDVDRFAAEWISRFVDPNFEPHFKLGRSDGTRAPAVEFARHLFGWHAALRGRVLDAFTPLLALAAAYRAVTAPSSKPRAWVEKTPLNERHVGRFAFFGAARFIQLVRDPRAVLASLGEIYRAGDLGCFDAAASARAIGRSLRLAERNPQRLDNRYLVVRYEDLVGEPAQQIERVRRFLGISAHTALSVPTEGGRAVAANSAFGSSAGIIGRARPQPNLPAEQLAWLALYTADAAQRFGYELAVPPPLARCALHLKSLPRLVARVASALPGLRRGGQRR